MNTQKKLKEGRTVMERRRLVDPKDPLSVRTQTDLLEVDRSSLYYKSLGESEQNLALTRRIDELFLEDRTLGVLGMQDELSVLLPNCPTNSALI